MSPLIFFLLLTVLRLVLRKAKAGYQFTNSEGKINHLLYADNMNLFDKNEKEIDFLIQIVKLYIRDIDMEFGRDKWEILVMRRGQVINSEIFQLSDGFTLKPFKEEGGTSV